MPTRRDFLASSASLLAASQIARASGLAPARVPVSNSRLALFEPESGCYIGAFIERDTRARGNISLFEAATQKQHASYFTYVGYGKSFPQGWINKIARTPGAPRAPHIAFEPNEGLDKVEDTGSMCYLRRWARDAARTKVPIFLRWASEMNCARTNHLYGQSPEKYKEKFRLVSKIMKQEAPNVAMVWTPFATPTNNIDSYYPGDEWVDWVGMNIYSVFVHNGDRNVPAAEEDPVGFLDFIYKGYAARKPIHISEFAATVKCKGTGEDTSDWAQGKARRFYEALRTDYPRVKSVNWFCLDTIKTGLANNDYSLLSKGAMTSTYSQLVAGSHFLSQVDFNPKDWNHRIQAGTTVDPKALSYGDASDDMLLNSEALASIIDRPFLRGIKNGDVISDDLILRLLMPQDVQPRGVFWVVDGATVAITSGKEMRGSLLQRIIPRERFVEGTHTATVEVNADTLDGPRRMVSDPVTFVIR